MQATIEKVTDKQQFIDLIEGKEHYEVKERKQGGKVTESVILKKKRTGFVFDKVTGEFQYIYNWKE